MIDEDNGFRAQVLAQEFDAAVGALADMDELASKAALRLRESLEKIYLESIKMIVKTLRKDAEGSRILFELVDDPVVALSFSLAGLLRPPLSQLVTEQLVQHAEVLEANHTAVEVNSIKDGVVKLSFASGSLSRAMLESFANSLIGQLCLAIPQAKGFEIQALDAAFVSPVTLSPTRRPVDRWTSFGLVSEIVVGRPKVGKVGGRDVIVVAHNDEFSCFENACSHMELPLDRASVDADGVLVCPWHGFRFDGLTGECITFPDVFLERHECKVVDGEIFVKVGP